MGEVISIRQDDAYRHTLENLRVWAKAEIDCVGFTNFAPDEQVEALAATSIEDVIAEASEPQYYLSRATARAVIDTCMSVTAEKYSVK